MSWLADAHREWHLVNGARSVCPLDCGVGEAEAEMAYMEQVAEEEAHAAFRARIEAARAEAIATGRTVKVGP